MSWILIISILEVRHKSLSNLPKLIASEWRSQDLNHASSTSSFYTIPYYTVRYMLVGDMCKVPQNAWLGFVFAVELILNQVKIRSVTLRLYYNELL